MWRAVLSMLPPDLLCPLSVSLSFCRDFIVRVVQGPVVLAGNSIGGFLSATAAADYPQLIRGLVLINSAGPIDPEFDAIQHAAEPARQPPPSLVPAMVTPLLMGYLENSIGDQLKWLYPTNPDAADAWLEEEIFRWVGGGGRQGGGIGWLW